jgi:hypothetical protein
MKRPHPVHPGERYCPIWISLQQTCKQRQEFALGTVVGAHVHGQEQYTDSIKVPDADHCRVDRRGKHSGCTSPTIAHTQYTEQYVESPFTEHVDCAWFPMRIERPEPKAPVKLSAANQPEQSGCQSDDRCHNLATTAPATSVAERDVK